MLAMTTKPDRRVTKINFPLRERKKKITFLRVQMVFEDSELNACEFVSLSVKSYVCALTPGSFPTPRLWAWACFREPRCHLPPNSNSVVDQQLFTNRQEDGTNLITPYSLVSPSLETVSIWAPHTFSVAGRHKLSLTAIMNIVFHSSGREPGNNEVLTKSSVPQIT